MNISNHVVAVSARTFKVLKTFLIAMLLILGGSGSIVSGQTMSGGQYHSLFLKDNGTVWSCGYNNDGQLGDGTLSSHSTPVQASNLSGIVAVVAGGYHSLFLKSDGTVWTCGQNNFGQLGDGTLTSHSTPTQVATLTNVVAIAAGQFFSIFLKSDGTVWACGRNDAGQLGDGTTTDHPVPAQMNVLTGVAAIAAGRDFCIFLKTNTTVWGCGQGGYGQLGDGTTTQRKTPVASGSLSGVIAIAAGVGHSLFLKSDNTVWACGSNYYGELGDGTSYARSTPLPISGLTGITAVAAGYERSLFLKSDGTAMSCGYNTNGNLGDGTTAHKYAAVAVVSLTGITAIASGEHHALFLRNDNNVWGCGDNTYGPLGTASGGGHPTAVQVGINLIAPPVWYSKSTGNLNDLATWGANADGSGTSPINFTAGSTTYNIVNNLTPTISAAWAPVGTVNVGDGVAAINFTIPSGFAYTGDAINVLAGAALTVNNTTIPTFGTLNAASTVVYGGSSTQTITSGVSYGNLTIGGGSTVTHSAGGSLSVNGAFVTTGTTTLRMGANSLSLSVYPTPGTVNSNGTIEVGGGSLPNGKTWGGTIVYNGGTQTVTNGSYNNLTLAGSGVKTMSTMSVNGVLSMEGTAATSISFLSFGPSATLQYNKTGPAIAGREWQATFSGSGGVVIANTGDITLNEDKTVAALHLNGSTSKLNTDVYSITIPGAAANVTGASATTYVIGTMIKTGDGSNALTFEVGDATGYTPMNLKPDAAITAGSIGVKVNTGNHPDEATSGLVSGQIATHYWTLTNNGVAGPSTIMPVVTYNAGDIPVGNNNNYKTQIYNAGAWLPSPLATTNTAAPYTSAANSGIALASFAGDYIVGDAIPVAPDVSNFTSIMTGDICSGRTARVLITSSTLVTGAIYTANYTLTGGNTGGPYTSAPFTYDPGSGVFFIDAVNVPNAGTTMVAVNYVTEVATSLSSATPAANNTATFNIVEPRVHVVTGGGAYCVGGIGVAIGLDGSESGVNYALYNEAGLVTTLAGTNTTLDFGLQATAGTYTVVGVDVLMGCSSNMNGTPTVTITPLPSTQVVTGGGAYCAGSIGAPVGLSGSEPGVNYTLFNGVTPLLTLPGTGSNLNFGLQFAGTYTVVANAFTACSATMLGNAPVTENALPTAFTMTGGGAYCAGGTGVAIGLAGSQGGVVYFLGIVGEPSGPPSLGSGAALDFGLQANPGIYQVVATSLLTSCSNTMSSNVTVTMDMPLPAITGNTTLMQGATTTLSNEITGGIWSSVTTSVATIGAASGIVMGVTPGMSIVNYAVGACTASTMVTVDAAPVINYAVCVGQTITLDNGGIPGGTWTSASGSIAPVGLHTGVVTGVHAGNVIMYYHLPSGLVTTTVTVRALAATGGASAVCQGQLLTLANTTPGGGMWSSDDEGVATVSGSGVVTGAGGGMAVISFTTNDGCIATKNVTVKPSRDITGDMQVCVGQTTLLSAGTTGGNWLSSSAALAAVSSSGAVRGIAAGSPRITYIPTNGCWSVATVSVNALSATVGVATICNGQQAAFTNTTSGGGAWSSGNTEVATVTAGGVVTGVGTGTTTIQFTSVAGCVASKTVTIKPAAILTGEASVCKGQTINISNSTGGGAWSSSGNAIATVSPAGVVTGVAAGTVHISYSIAGGCASAMSVTINALSATTGAGSVCLGQTTMLANTTAGGGIWSSGNTTVATVSSTGVVSGAGTGAAVISFVTPAGCTALQTINVSGGAVIQGLMTACTGQVTSLSADVAGGVWGSSNMGVAAISASGAVTGVSAGVVRITYALSGCQSIATMTVNPLSATTGAPITCQNQAVTLTNTTPGGGVWSSGNTAIATVSPAGVVNGASGGSVIISFTANNGCVFTKTVTLNATAQITGITTVCVGQETNLSSSVGGGNWISSSGSLAAVSVAGVVSGVSAGSLGITYVAPGGCWSAVAVTVRPLSAITGGTMGMCQSGTMTLANATPLGGVWSSSNTAVATVNGAGQIRGAGAGITIISFTAISSGCVASRSVTVNACREANGASVATVDDMDGATFVVRLFPNPNKGVFTLKGSMHATNATIEVINMVGQVIYRKEVITNNDLLDEQVTINDNFANGMYMLKLNTDVGTKLFHFIVGR